jgi:hypothetical protein
VIDGYREKRVGRVSGGGAAVLGEETLKEWVLVRTGKDIRRRQWPGHREPWLKP